MNIATDYTNYNMIFKDYPDVLNIEQLTEILHIGRNTAYKLVNNKFIKSVRIGKTYKIPKCYVIDYLQNASWWAVFIVPTMI